MPVTRRRSRHSTGERMKDEVIFISEEESPPKEMEVQRKRLRQRWELASVLNFLNVFEPVIESNMKISAEEIETALIEPNDSLIQLHIALLKEYTPRCMVKVIPGSVIVTKGVVPPKKSLDASEAWLSILSKKLAMWWPWVAEGDFPLIAAKGEEMTRYKQLDPTIRLSILKALCEIRADQNDIVSYINNAVKNGNGLSTFRKDKLGHDGNGTVYWYDGSAIIGHRLYKEVCTFEHKPKAKDKEAKVAINSQWETLATNFEEFQKWVNEFTSSELQWEVSVGKAVEADAIPALKKLQRKKDRLPKLQKKQEMLLNGFCASRITRSGRNFRPISYRFEDYDKAIEEAIEVTQIRKTAEDLGHGEKINKRKKGQNVSIGDSDNSRDNELAENVTDTEMYREGDNDRSRTGQGDDIILHFQKLNGWMVHGSNGSRCSERLSGTDKGTVPETMSLTSKQRLRQRATINIAVDSAVVPDSEDENC